GQIAGAEDDAVVAIVVPGASSAAFDPVEISSAEVHSTDTFLAFVGTTSLLGSSNVSILFALQWDAPDQADAEFAIAAGIDSFSLSALNAAWRLPDGGDIQVS